MTDSMDIRHWLASGGAEREPGPGWPERPPDPTGLYEPERPELDGLALLALGAGLLAGAGAVVYARRRDWLRLGVCAVALAGSGWLGWRIRPGS